MTPHLLINTNNTEHNLRNFINSIKQNQKIDYHKMDQYQSIIRNAMLEYCNNEILVSPFIDNSIITSID